MGSISNFVSTHMPRRSSRRGFVTGIALALLATTGVLSASHFVAADSFPSRHNQQDAQPAATTPDATTTNSFGGQPQFSSPQSPSPSANTSQPTNNTYVALGDSVAAGLGLPLIANATTQDATCGRSSQSYAYEVGRQLGRPTTLLACSGATAGDLNTQQGIDGPNPPAQIRSAFANGTPGLISITAGANDSYWQRFIQKCYTSTCGSRSDTVIANTALRLMQAKYQVAMENIRIRAAANASPTPMVVLTGYYNPLSQACLAQPALSSRLTQAELTWLTGSINALNKTISDMAASYSGFARYAAVDFSGHDLCSAEPWIQGLSDAAPVHPTTAGQQAIARSVLDAARR